MTDDVLQDPGPAAPDGADWTWVLTRPCPDCGFDAAHLGRDQIPELLQDAKRRYAAVLGQGEVRARPASGVWSPLEYSCHVRDVCVVMTARLEQILDGCGRVVTFADWDQDRAAANGRYWRSDPTAVQQEVTDAFDAAAAAYARPVEGEWAWPALRSNGSRFTAETLARYFLHDVRHHLWDVRG
ncbi:MAG: DinB family protein [Dermatophilaceae bacterium]